MLLNAGGGGPGGGPEAEPGQCPERLSQHSARKGRGGEAEVNDRRAGEAETINGTLPPDKQSEHAVNSDLAHLVDLQALDTRLAGLEREMEAIPAQIKALHDERDRARQAVDGLKAQAETVRKEIRVKEKDVEFSISKRAKSEAKLYEVKTNKEYSAVLLEIEQIKQEKAQLEDQLLGLMESQERLAGEIRTAEAHLTGREEELREKEAVLQSQLREVEVTLGGARSEREALARELPPSLAAQYQRLLARYRGTAVVVPAQGEIEICAGCHLSLTPQCFQEVRQNLQIIPCERCGRILYWVP